MIFTITSFNKIMDVYEVISDAGERRVVSAVQIVNVMANGYEFNNAYLTRKGFAIVDAGRTKYIQLANMTTALDKAVTSRLKYLKDIEEAKKQQMTAAIKRPIVKSNTHKINSTPHRSSNKQ